MATQNVGTSDLKIFLLGPPQIELAGTLVEMQRRKALALLAYLAVSGQSHRRDTLATLLWPDQSQQRARAYLRRDLATLNKILVGNWLAVDRETVGLNNDLAIWLDVTHFRQLIMGCQAHSQSVDQNKVSQVECPACLSLLTKAVTLYRDEFMAGFTLRDSPDFDEWQFFQREALCQSLAHGLERLVHMHQAKEDFERALAYARRWLALDPMHEPAHRHLMQIYDQMGQQAAAIRQYTECVRVLNEELGVSPERDTITLYEAIKAKRLIAPLLQEQEHREQRERQQEIAEKKGAVAEAHLPSAWAASQHNLPSHPTAFIGRAKELVEIRQLIVNEMTCRLLTLVGPGGIGKTRLATQIAQELIDLPSAQACFADGILFVLLDPVSSTGGIISAIAEAANFNFSSDISPREQFLDYLRKKKMLLILDNFEHLLAEVDLISEILATAPGVKILVTSREALNLQEAWFHSVKGLSFPKINLAEAISEAEYEAVELFKQSARRARVGFSLEAGSEVENSEILAHVVRICRLVDGMPLAIELAAAWLKVLPLAKVADEIERSLDILTARHQNIPERHRSMRVVLEQSWKMLDPEEQLALQQLSIFQGGFRQEGASQIAEASFLTLAALVEKSLLRLDETGRYHLHELLRQLASEKLAAAHLEPSVAQRHSTYYLKFLTDHETALYGPRPTLAIAALKGEIDNIRQAWQWAVAQAQLALLVAAIEPLAAFYEFTGLFSEGEQVFGEAVQQLETSPPSDEMMAALCHLRIKYILFVITQGRDRGMEGEIDRATVCAQRAQNTLRLADLHYINGSIAMNRGDLERATEQNREAVKLYQSLGEQRLAAAALDHLGEVLSRQQMPADALACHQQALQIGITLNDIRRQALSLSHMGVAYYYKDDYRLALTHWERAVASFEQLNDLRGLGRTLNNMGYIHNALGNYDQALRYLNRTMPLLQQIGDQRSEANACDTLGDTLFAQGAYAQARECYTHALRYAQEMELLLEEAVFLTNLSRLDIAMGRYEEAEEQLQRASAGVKKIGHPKEIAKTTATLGVLYQHRGQIEQALAYYNQAIEQLQEAGEQNDTAQLLVQKGVLYFESGNIEEAKSLVQAGLEIARQIGRKPTIFQAERLIAKIISAQGRAKDAHRQLQNLLTVAATQAERAAIHYTLWQIEQEREQARQALSLYQDLADQTPDVLYQNRAQELQAALTERFVQETLIATGGMGEVYQGRDTETGRRVAIKRLKPELVAQNPEAVKRLIREGEALRQLNHPNIVKVLATVEAEEEPLIVMEYISGGSLQDLLEAQPQLPFDQVLKIGLELADALARAHHLGIIHRDLKPANILMTEDGAPRLTDFGVAHLSHQETRLTQEGVILGTGIYMSPEAWRGEELDPRSDIWAFGALMYEMLAGRPPFAGKQIAAILTAILNDPPPNLDQLRPDTPPALAALIKHMLVKERELRIDSMRQVAAGLEVVRHSMAPQ